ncbi:hypothetical protein A1F99_000320 [Pyrenophora tritici-repentis]|nr:hypothetical protein A1F99_000320 [Pyrenophora tritici-repentis]
MLILWSGLDDRLRRESIFYSISDGIDLATPIPSQPGNPRTDLKTKRTRELATLAVLMEALAKLMRDI